MNDMVFELQPEIIVNNRNGLPGDFSTPEQESPAAHKGRAWETCMTLNAPHNEVVFKVHFRLLLLQGVAQHLVREKPCNYRVR